MAGTFTANLTLVAQGESGDSGTWAGNSGAHDTEIKIQNTASYTWQASKNARTSCTYTPTTNIDMSGTDNHLYWWAKNDVAPFMEAKTTGTTNTSGYHIRLTDGSGNYKEWHIAGSDTWGGEWRCFVLDLSSSTDVYASSGTLSLTDIDIITWYVDISNSGNIRIIDNQWNDVIRFGTGITATGTDFDLTDMAADDESSSNKYGILENIDGVIFCQGRITIGNGATTTTFNSTDEVLTFRDRISTNGKGQVSSTLYELNFVGSGNTTNIQGLVCKGAGTTDTTRPYIDASDTNADVTVAGSSFIHCDLVDFASTSDVQNSVFSNCFQIDPSTSIFKNNTISNYIGSEGGAILYPSSDTNFTNLKFISNATGGHIEFDGSSDSTPTFDHLTFTGDLHINTGANTTITADNVIVSGSVYNDDTAHTLTINVIASSTITAGDPGTGNGQTDVQNTVVVKITVVDSDTGLPIPSAHVRLNKSSDKSSILSGTVNASGIIQDTGYNYSTDTDVEGWARKYDLSSTLYIQKEITGTITDTGFDQTVELVKM